MASLNQTLLDNSFAQSRAKSNAFSVDTGNPKFSIFDIQHDRLEPTGSSAETKEENRVKEIKSKKEAIARKILSKKPRRGDVRHEKYNTLHD